MKNISNSELMRMQLNQVYGMRLTEGPYVVSGIDTKYYEDEDVTAVHCLDDDIPIEYIVKKDKAEEIIYEFKRITSNKCVPYFVVRKSENGENVQDIITFDEDEFEDKIEYEDEDDPPELTEVLRLYTDMDKRAVKFIFDCIESVYSLLAVGFEDMAYDLFRETYLDFMKFIRTAYLDNEGEVNEIRIVGISMSDYLDIIDKVHSAKIEMNKENAEKVEEELGSVIDIIRKVSESL